VTPTLDHDNDGRLAGFAQSAQTVSSDLASATSLTPPPRPYLPWGSPLAHSASQRPSVWPPPSVPASRGSHAGRPSVPEPAFGGLSIRASQHLNVYRVIYVMGFPPAAGRASQRPSRTPGRRPPWCASQRPSWTPAAKVSQRPASGGLSVPASCLRRVEHPSVPLEIRPGTLRPPPSLSAAGLRGRRPRAAGRVVRALTCL
jgi:hypothetical protein